MMDKSLENLRYWVEPAHPMIVRLYDDLVSIYRNIKENYQKEIDASFDRASQQLGFVITTTVPVTLEVGENGDIKNLNISSERLKGTIFEKELSRSIEAMKRGMPAVPATSAGEKGLPHKSSQYRLVRTTLPSSGTMPSGCGSGLTGWSLPSLYTGWHQSLWDHRVPCMISLRPPARLCVSHGVLAAGTSSGVSQCTCRVRCRPTSLLSIKSLHIDWTKAA